ncbi:CatA-like O-acetyltransferase [Pedobacter psychrotolerans]|uniref:CatA-like O-acetyltransferase n=1 Tax=Pedobacter psychrotolerans TaxID=1843235 RepID=UPI003F9D039C
MEIPTKDIIDISTWKRKAHYNFFSTFDQPFFGVTSLINCTEAYQFCKAYQIPFFLYYLHKSLLAANHIKEFRYRIEADEVVEYSLISGSITVLRNDETFGFAYFNYQRDFKIFSQETRNVIMLEKAAVGLTLKPDVMNMIHYSILPGINFTSMQHAQMLKAGDHVPKIVFGKLLFKDGQVLLPVSVHVHHALCDGVHVSKFLSAFEQSMQVTGT